MPEVEGFRVRPVEVERRGQLRHRRQAGRGVVRDAGVIVLQLEHVQADQRFGGVGVPRVAPGPEVDAEIGRHRDLHLRMQAGIDPVEIEEAVAGVRRVLDGEPAGLVARGQPRRTGAVANDRVDAGAEVRPDWHPVQSEAGGNSIDRRATQRSGVDPLELAGVRLDEDRTLERPAPGDADRRAQGLAQEEESTEGAGVRTTLDRVADVPGAVVRRGRGNPPGWAGRSCQSRCGTDRGR